MSSLREQMIQQKQLMGYSQQTIVIYLNSIQSLSKHYNQSPDEVTWDQIRFFIQRELIEKQISQSYINQLISALKILFVQILHREWDPRTAQKSRFEGLSWLEVLRLVIGFDVTKCPGCKNGIMHPAGALQPERAPPI